MNKIGVYHIIKLLGAGGMGKVYLARHSNDIRAQSQGGEVALKVLHPQYAEDESFLTRFEREANIGLTIDHPNIVKVLDIVVDGDSHALVIEYIKGRPLSEMIENEVGPIPYERAWMIAKQILEAIQYAHAMNIVHRDIKPENIMVTEGDAIKILDFGIAKDQSTGKTKTGTGMGTIDYMAPEQFIDAKNVDYRADIYAIGMTLYEMLAGTLPWDPSDTEFGIMKKKEVGNLPPPTDFYPHIPERFTKTINMMLVSNKEERLTDINTIIALLEGTDPLPVKSQAIKTPPASSSAQLKTTTPQAAPAPVTGGLSLPMIGGLVLGALVLVSVVDQFSFGPESGTEDDTETVLETQKISPVVDLFENSNHSSTVIPKLKSVCGSSQLAQMSAYHLKITRNSFFALHGRRFNTQSLQDYFERTVWYEVNWNYSSKQVSANLSQWERDCITRIQGLEEIKASSQSGEDMSKATHQVFNTWKDTREPWLNLRRSANQKAGIVAQMKDGVQVRLLDTSGTQWYKVQVLTGEFAGKTGWAHSKWLRTLD
jgi:serine/threonine protein kinase